MIRSSHSYFYYYLCVCMCVLLCLSVCVQVYIGLVIIKVFPEKGGEKKKTGDITYNNVLECDQMKKLR